VRSGLHVAAATEELQWRGSSCLVFGIDLVQNLVSCRLVRVVTGETVSGQLACRGGHAQGFLPRRLGLCCASVLSAELFYFLTVWRPTSQGEKAGAFFGGGNGFRIGGVALEGDEGRIFLRRCACLHGVVSTLSSSRRSLTLKPKLYSLFILCLLVISKLVSCSFNTMYLPLRSGVINLTHGYGLMFISCNIRRGITWYVQ
jgi:hypothetical protein